MENLIKKGLGYLLIGVFWLIGIFFILGGIFSSNNASLLLRLFIILGGILMLPPVASYIARRFNSKVKGFVIAIFGFLVAMIAVGNTSQPVPPPTLTPATVEIKPLTNTPPTQPVTQPQGQPPTGQVQSSTKPVIQANVATVTPPTTTAAYDITCKVVGISDGDTLTCLNADNTQIKVRLNQIDAPEKDQAFGNAAKQALSGYVFGKTVGLKTVGIDKYGRTLAEVYLEDKNINKAMVADGYGWAYREYMKDNEYANLETAARSSTKGLWSEPNPIYPSDFRRGKRGEQSAPVQTQTITQQVEQKAVTDSGGSCGSKRYCKEMATCAEARHYLNDCGVSRLDRDGDGVPCESICN